MAIHKSSFRDASILAVTEVASFQFLALVIDALTSLPYEMLLPLAMFMAIICTTIFRAQKKKTTPGGMTIALVFWISLYVSILSIPTEVLLMLAIKAVQTGFSGLGPFDGEFMGLMLIMVLLGGPARGVATFFTFALLTSRKKI